ncbi:MAG: HIT domain-containing protein [Leptolyngbya sp. SIO3F4]|nr:HIT domain-containing protein [Leptolyngbya sp. SIO3F4]
MTNEKKSCFLCGDLEHHGGHIAQSKNFKVLSDIAPLQEGHLLISTIKHYYSLSDLDMNALSELSRVTDWVYHILTQVYGGTVVFFEHGMSSNCNLSACGVEHAHLHAIPLNEEKHPIFSQTLRNFLAKTIMAEKLICVPIYDFRHLKAAQNRNYLLLKDIDCSMKLYLSSSQFPSQLLRRYMSEYIGLPFQYNWQLFMDEEKAQKTTTSLRSQFGDSIWP